MVKEKEPKVAQSQSNGKKNKKTAVATKSSEERKASCTTSLGVTYIRGNAFVF